MNLALGGRPLRALAAAGALTECNHDAHRRAQNLKSGLAGIPHIEGGPAAATGRLPLSLARVARGPRPPRSAPGRRAMIRIVTDHWHRCLQSAAPTRFQVQVDYAAAASSGPGLGRVDSVSDSESDVGASAPPPCHCRWQPEPPLSPSQRLLS